MSFTQAIGSGFSRYVDFSGRSSRSEYWWWFLFAFASAIGTLILDAIIGTTPVIYLIVVLGLLLPNLSVTFRRLHDKGKSAWWILIAFIPLVGVIGAIVLLIWFIGEGEAGENQYGPNPG